MILAVPHNSIYPGPRHCFSIVALCMFRLPLNAPPSGSFI
jgi:hypothetical protein